ncbi:MAG: recombination regulator RecX [Rhodoferax sp.]
MDSKKSGQPPGLSSANLQAKALRLLAQREHTRAELVRKLQRWSAGPGVLEAALDALQAKGLISTQRVVESVVRQRAARMGTQRIRHELRQKGIDDADMADAIAQLRQTELDRALALWQKRFGHAAADAAERARQARFLAGRGFSAAVIARVLRADPDAWADPPAYDE